MINIVDPTAERKQNKKNAAGKIQLLMAQNQQLIDQNKKLLEGQNALYELIKTITNKTKEKENIDPLILMPTFPLNTTDEMLDFNSKLSNQSYLKQMVCY